MMEQQVWRTRVCIWLLATAIASPFLTGWPRSTAAQASDETEALRAPQVTLEDALRSAFERHPDLRAAHALVGRARGALVGAKVYPFNPVFLGLAGGRSGIGDGSVDLGFELGQRVEIAGQRRRRMQTTEAELAAEIARFERRARLLAAQVHVTFINALESHQLLEIANADVELTRRLFDFAERRLERGAATQLEVNLAATEFGRSQGRAQLAAGQLQAARTELGQAMAADPAAPPAPRGKLEVPDAPRVPIDELVADALENRADVEAFRAFEKSSQARLRLARSEGAPDITVRGFWEREGPEQIVGGGGNIAIPIFQRNQGPIAESRATVSLARAQRESAELAVAQETAAMLARYEAASGTAKRLEETVLGSLQQNLDLLQKSLEAGKTTWPEVLIIRRSLIDARRELVRAQAEAGRAWIQLQLATGQMPVPPLAEGALR